MIGVTGLAACPLCFACKHNAHRIAKAEKGSQGPKSNGGQRVKQGAFQRRSFSKGNGKYSFGGNDKSWGKGKSSGKGSKGKKRASGYDNARDQQKSHRWVRARLLSCMLTVQLLLLQGNY